MRPGAALGCLLALGVLSTTAAAASYGPDSSGPVRQASVERDPVESAAAPSAAGVVVPPAVRGPVSGSGRRTTQAAAPDRWTTRTAAAAGIPEPAVRAYGRATLQVPAACHLGWTTLAGIGWVESQHGTIGGRTVDVAGRSSTPILGPALDGRGPVAAIEATARSSAWHGDPDWDHAVGPLQFIPSTWDTWASDGDGDGVADPHDLDDAALATARYLCHSGDLGAEGVWARAVFSYNHSDAYVQSVLVAADTYAARAADG